MTIQFFETELLKIQDKFNELFGNQIVCNVQARSKVILCIVSLGLLNKKIRNASNKDEARDDIRDFIKHRDVISAYFEKAQENLNERRNYVNFNKRIKTHGCGVDRTNRRLSQMQKPIHRHLA